MLLLKKWSKASYMTIKDAAFHAHDRLLNANLQCHLNWAATCNLKPQFVSELKLIWDPTILSGFCCDLSSTQSALR